MNKILEANQKKFINELDELLSDVKEKLNTFHVNVSNISFIKNLIKVKINNKYVKLGDIAELYFDQERNIMVTPFDDNINLKELAKEIKLSDDSYVIKFQNESLQLIVPTITTERRREILKKIEDYIKEMEISFRNRRHKFINDIKKDKSSFSKDDLIRFNKEI